MKIKWIVSLAIAWVCAFSVSAQNENVYVSLLNKTFSEGNVNVLKPYLANDFRFGTYPSALGNMLLEKYVTNLKTFLRCDGVAQEQKGDTTLYQLNLSYSNPTRYIPVFLSVSGNKICAMTFKTDQMLSLEKGIPIQIAAPQTYPFRLVNNMIVLDQVLIDGFKGTFVLDTGANATVLNPSTHFAYKVQSVRKATTHGVHGATTDSTAIVQVDSLCLGGVKWHHFRVTTSPLSAMQKQLGLEELTGLIGASQLLNCELHIDYVHKVLSFKAIDEKGDLLGAQEETPKCALPFSVLNGYATVLDVKIGNRFYKMMFDTGASGNVYSKAFYQPLKSYLKDQKTTDLLGGNDKKVQVVYAKLNDFYLGTLHLSESSALFVEKPMNMGTIGIFGTDIVKDSHISLNYKKQLLSIY